MKNLDLYYLPTTYLLHNLQTQVNKQTLTLTNTTVKANYMLIHYKPV